ncbi:MAG: hypothetical protein ACREDS_16675, partial [Limisphaerales bacterium]
MNVETNKDAASIPKAAKQLGVDSFSLYSLIQHDKVRPRRERWGELVILQVELDRVLKKSVPSPDDEKKRGDLCH